MHSKKKKIASMRITGSKFSASEVEFVLSLGKLLKAK